MLVISGEMTLQSWRRVFQEFLVRAPEVDGKCAGGLGLLHVGCLSVLDLT